MHPVPEIRPATAADLETVAATLADAFAQDPVLSWLLPPTARRQRARMNATWRATARGYLRRGKPVFVTADGKGAALWSAPGAWAPTPSEQLRDALPFALIFRSALPKASRFATEIGRKHPRAPHWYLYAIGAHTSTQGRGIGSALLRDRLDELDQTGEAAYLESSNILNVPLYQRHGFEVVEEITISGGGPTMWRMWRDPA
jgi:ribosomal protein S18 acetylase RimI-like enzyme